MFALLRAGRVEGLIIKMSKMKADPLLDAGMRGLIVNMATRNYWRVCAWYDLEDLIQDGYLCYTRVRRRYPKVKEVRHLTALFKTTFSRHIIDLANDKREQQEVCVSQIAADDSDGTAELETMLGFCEGEQTAMVLLRSMPAELRQLWRFLRSQDGRDKLCQPRLKVGGVRETTNEHLCRLLGLDPEVVNLPEMARLHFLG